jgi:hypothetical protein
MKKITLPNPVIMIFGGLAAFWVADIIHPGFNPIGVMILLLIPLLIVEILFPKEGLKEQIEQMHQTPQSKEPVSGEIVDEVENNESV